MGEMGARAKTIKMIFLTMSRARARARAKISRARARAKISRARARANTLMTPVLLYNQGKMR